MGVSERPEKHRFNTTTINSNNIPDRERYFGCAFDAGLSMGDENTPTGLTEGMDVVMKGKRWGSRGGVRSGGFSILPD